MNHVELLTKRATNIDARLCDNQGLVVVVVVVVVVLL